MNILLLTSHLEIGGITSYLFTVATGLKARGHQVRIASGGGAMAETFETHGIPHLHLPVRTKSELDPQLWLACHRLTRFLRSHRVDVLHAQTRVTQVVGALVSRSTGIPMLSTWHGFFRPHWGRRLFPCMGRLVIAISPPVRDDLLHHFHVSPERVALIEHGIPVERFQAPSAEAQRTLRQEFGIPRDAFVIGAVARLVPDKGIDRLIQAVARVALRHPQARALIVGSGPEEARLRALAASLQLTDRVLFLGSQQDLIAPLSVMDCFVFPILRREGFGLALLEAMAMELPIIATHQPALERVLDQGRAGLLVPPDDADALARAITHCIEEPASAEQLALRGFARVRDCYTSNRMLDQLEAAYTHVLTRTRPTTVARSA